MCPAAPRECVATFVVILGSRSVAGVWSPEIDQARNLDLRANGIVGPQRCMALRNLKTKVIESGWGNRGQQGAAKGVIANKG